jgi:GDP-L-fucose synthase
MSAGFSLATKRVWVAGHTGLVGGALVRRLNGRVREVLTAARAVCDLRDQRAVREWIAANRPDAIFIAAGLVGGIEANRTRPGEFLYDNLIIAANIIQAAAAAGVQKLMFLGSSCFYPRDAEQPIREETLLTGPFEPTNEAYAVAKIAGAKLCQSYRRQYGRDFIAVVPTNLYGPGDNFDLAGGHVVAAMLRRFHEARLSGAGEVELWGTGRPRREFLYVDDAADALVYLMEHYSGEGLVNVAGGQDVTIAELAGIVAEVVGYTGSIRYDVSRPDGMPRKALDARILLAAGWRPQTPLKLGLQRTYRWFLDHAAPASRAGAR